MKIFGISILILFIGICIIVNITNFEKKLDTIAQRQEQMLNKQDSILEATTNNNAILMDVIDMLGDTPCTCLK